MVKKSLISIFASLVCATLLVTCAESEAPSVTPERIATEQLTLVPTHVPPIPTNTPRAIVVFPTSTPLPSPTPTPEPTQLVSDGEYPVEIIRVMDGDTLEVEIEEVQIEGLKKQTVRVFGIDTPETRTSDAFEKVCGNWSKKRANDFVSDDGQYVLVTEFEDGGFSRILGDIRSPEGALLSEFMLDEGLAVPYEGGTRNFEDHRANCDALAEAGHIAGIQSEASATATEKPAATAEPTPSQESTVASDGDTSPSPTATATEQPTATIQSEAVATATENPTATTEPTSEPTPSQEPTVTPGVDTSPSPTATATEQPTVTVENDEIGVTYETCEEAEAAGLEREPGTQGPGWGFPVEIVTGERDGDGDGYVCEESGSSSNSPKVVDTPEVAPAKPDVTAEDGEIYLDCDAASEAGAERIKGEKGDGRGFPAWQIPSARDGDGDGVVCER